MSVTVAFKTTPTATLEAPDLHTHLGRGKYVDR